MELAALVQPEGHGVQEDAPDGLKVPVGHTPITPVLLHELPAGQMMTVRRSLVYQPFGTTWHTAAPAVENVPFAQAVQALAPRMADVPAGHCTGSAPVAQLEPPGHSTQEEAPLKLK